MEIRARIEHNKHAYSHVLYTCIIHACLSVGQNMAS